MNSRFFLANERCSNRVIPSSTEFIQLSAELIDGTIVDGESNIPHAGKKIKRVFSSPEHPKPEGAALRAIDEADVIILGPGSLYTSIIPNLLTDKIADHVRASKANKIYIANVMTQPGETSGYTLADHVQAIIDHLNWQRSIIGENRIDDAYPTMVDDSLYVISQCVA